MSHTILITGGSRGIGAATAIAAAQKGYAVCLNYLHNAEAAAQVVNTIRKEGGRAEAVRADVATSAGVKDLFSFLDAHFNGISALVNNAGILYPQMRVEEMDEARLQRLFQTNIISAFLCAREAIKRMALTGGGKGGAIVNVSSVAARTGAPGEYVDYAASKGAIDTFTVGLAKEVAAEGIRVNAVRPGFIYTDIHASGGEPDRVNRLKDSIPLRRGGQPEEVAAAILWLLSAEAAYSTGTFIDVSGGR